MANSKTVTVLINKDGTVEVDQKGYTGKECSGEVDDLVKALGEDKKVVQKPEYYKDNKVQVKQRF